MEELELVGLHEDGEHVVLTSPGGDRFRVRIDEPLRAAVRRDRPQLEQLRSGGAPSPREIQTRIRAGATAEEVADQAGVSIEQVRRYEGPVLAEREFVAAQARGTRVGREADAPVLGELVTDRLAARGVDLGTLDWDAARHPDGPWVVVARFAVGDEAREARWTFDQASRSVRADEDEARWLSETEIADEPIARRHLAAVRDVVFDYQVAAPLVADDDAADLPPDVVEPVDPTHSLLDELRDRRGVRQAVELDAQDDDAEEFEGFGPQHAFDFAGADADLPDVPGAHPVDADPAREAQVLAAPTLLTFGEPAEPAGQGDPAVTTEPAASEAAAPDRQRARSRRSRAQVPSWDEIVFGAKPE